MTAAERRWQALVRQSGCIVCRNLGYGDTPASLHHIREGQGGGQKAPDYLVLPLCPDHHQNGGHGVALHAGQATWEQNFGTELELLAQVIGETFGGRK